MKILAILTLLSPLVGSLLVAFWGRRLGRVFAHSTAIVGVAIATICSVIIFSQVNFNDRLVFEQNLYTWMRFANYQFEIGFLIDALSSTMMLVVSFVSLMVHIYTIGYMDHDEDYDYSNPYYQRFFSYISLFTFAMLALVMSNNFLLLFFGWEAVGLVSYLLIGFYLKRESAVQANLKAFLVNRVGDLGFLLGIGVIFYYFDTLNYLSLFELLEGPKGQALISLFGQTEWQVVTVASLLLFIGAMGKSAQMPLHIWLPESMEGPTPISALIHAATMVTAGIYMIARLTPLFEMSDITLSTILVVGSTTAFLMGILGIVQNDIKRIVAYSTLSQLGYMIAALGASAYVAGFFHVFTHAFFKALLFLGAGSVIVALHHKQNINNMGGLRRYMPITYLCMLMGTLAIIGTPGFSGFFSKDSIILTVGQSQLFGAKYAYVLLTISVFFTALYSFRLFFKVFHGQESEFVKKHKPKESPLVITIPLMLLAFFSVISGILVVNSWFFGDFFTSTFVVLEQHNNVGKVIFMYPTVIDLVLHSFTSIPFALTLFGIFVAWYCYIKKPELPEQLSLKFQTLYIVLKDAYGFDRFNERYIVEGSRKWGDFCWNFIDSKCIDKGIYNRCANSIIAIAQLIRNSQTGLIYHYVFVIITALMFLLAWVLYKFSL